MTANGDVHCRDPQWPVYVDSSRPLCVDTGPSVAQVWAVSADGDKRTIWTSVEVAASHARPSIRISKPESHLVRRRDAGYRNAYELALPRSAVMYLPNFLDGFDRLVAFDAETTGKRTPDAEFIRKQPFAWRAPGIIIEVGFVEMLREGEGWRKGEMWSSRVNPDGPIDPEAIKIHRIRPADLKNAPRFPTILPKVKDFVGDLPIVAHAYKNERDFLDYEFARAKVI